MPRGVPPTGSLGSTAGSKTGRASVGGNKQLVFLSLRTITDIRKISASAPRPSCAGMPPRSATSSTSLSMAHSLRRGACTDYGLPRQERECQASARRLYVQAAVLAESAENRPPRACPSPLGSCGESRKQFDSPNALRPSFVRKGDTLSSMTFWPGTARPRESHWKRYEHHAPSDRAEVAGAIQ